MSLMGKGLFLTALARILIINQPTFCLILFLRGVLWGLILITFHYSFVACFMYSYNLCLLCIYLVLCALTLPVSGLSWCVLFYTVKPVLSGHSQIDKSKILMTYGSLMKVESIAECSKGSILQYFWPALSDNWSWKPNFGLLFEWPLKTGFTVFFRKIFLYVHLLVYVSMYQRDWNIDELQNQVSQPASAQETWTISREQYTCTASVTDLSW